MSAKAAVMTNYCLYLINFYDEAIAGLERFIIKYPADKNVLYAKYLLILSLYEQILPEEKDISPLLKSKLKINEFSKPIKIGAGFILINLDAVKEEKQKINLEEKFAYIINKETNRQLNQYSSIHYKKIERQSFIYED
jgi:hypothetical protein